MADALDALEAQYILLTDNLPSLLAACQSDADKASIRLQYVTCRRNYFDCVNRIFKEDDPAIQALVDQMKREQTALEAAIRSMDAVTGKIIAITAAVQIGASLAAKV